MTVKELISILESFPSELTLGIASLDEDTGELHDIDRDGWGMVDAVDCDGNPTKKMVYYTFGS